VCGNIVELLHAGGGELVCCGQPMKLLVENTTEASTEKHIPVVEKTGSGYTVKIGQVPHPMEEKHFIEWIELRSGKCHHRKFLKPGDKPEACFDFCPECAQGGKIEAYAYCNIHGYWKGELK